MSELKYDSRNAARDWYLAGCSVCGILWKNTRNMNRNYKNALKKQKLLSFGRRINVLKNAMYENDARKFGTTWNKENANNNVRRMHSGFSTAIFYEF